MAYRILSRNNGHVDLYTCVADSAADLPVILEDNPNMTQGSVVYDSSAQTTYLLNSAGQWVAQ